MASEEVARPPCKYCGTPLPLGLGEGASIRMSDVTIQCPGCGRMNEFHGDLTTRRVGGRLWIVFQEMSPEQLRSVRDSLQGLLNRPDATIENVAESVEPASAGLAAWIRTLNENQGVIALIGILLMVIIALLGNQSPPANVTINQTITQLESGQTVNNPPLPRRQPCFCGSGKRYKNCHGRHVGTAAGADIDDG